MLSLCEGIHLRWLVVTTHKVLQFSQGKSLLHPQPMRVGTHHPQPMKMDFFYPLYFLKQNKSHPKAVLKFIVNHRKIIKWKIQLCWILNEYICTMNIYGIFSTFCYSCGEKYRSKVIMKICTKVFHIVCSLHRTTNLKSNTKFDFWFYDFFCDLL
jgi:hypothetical protein